MRDMRRAWLLLMLPSASGHRAAQPMVSRRAVLCASFLPATANAVQLVDDSMGDGATVAVGKIAWQPGSTVEVVDNAALYITARLPSSGGAKVPPLATARYARPVFPFEFRLSTADLTPEYTGMPSSEWETKDLVVSARYDVDGVAATRGPDDLVGRALLSKRGVAANPAAWADHGAYVELQGRGIAGRLLTGGSK